MTGAIMELCQLIKWPDPDKIAKNINMIHTEKEAEEAAKQLTVNSPQNYEKVLEIILNETIRVDEADKRWAALAEK